MILAFEDQSVIRGDFVLRAVQRFDLTPIPSTLEVTLRADSTVSARVGYGAVLIAGSSQDRYSIVKRRKATSEWPRSEDGPAEVVEITAVLESLVKLCKPLSRAVIREGSSLADIYRACGAMARVSADVPVPLFACLAGDYPTPGIGQVLQEEGAVVVWKANRSLAFTRLADLFKGDPILNLAVDTSIQVDSPFLEGHEIPGAVSTAKDGSIIRGRSDEVRGFVYLPRSSPRVLDNMTRCLVVRRILPGNFDGTIRAGDGVDIAGKRHVVVTAAHTWDTGSSGGGAEQTSRLWLGQLAT
jgi:hypothetical protein